jgi:hypothetical protein
MVVLQEMAEQERRFPLLLEGEDAELEPVVSWLHRRGLVEIVSNEFYRETARGRSAFARFQTRYDDFVRTMDVFSAVDVEEGAFAFERFFDFETDEDFEDYLRGDQWEDLRVAVAELKGIDPVELVFMSFLQEDRLGVHGSEPGTTLLRGPHWEEIEAICNTAVSTDDLAFEEDDDSVTGEEVLKQIVREGAELNIELKRQEAELAAEEGPSVSNSSPTESVEVVETRYTPYLDPLYLPPIWVGGWY